MVSERGIRESFSRVKEDVQGVRKSLTDLSQNIKALSAKSSILTEKKEFYDFIKALEARLVELEASLATKKELEKHSSEHKKEHSRDIKAQEKSLASLKSGLAEIRKSASGLSGQFRELSRTAGRLSSVESRIAALSDETGKVQMQKEAQNEMAKLKSELAAVQKDVSLLSGLQENVNGLSGQIRNVKSGLAKAEAAVLDVPDFGRLTKRLQDVEDRLSDTRKLVREADASELKAEVSSLIRDFAKLDNRFVAWNALTKHEKKAEQSFESLKAEIKQLRQSINEVVGSEVDLGEYVLKGELKESLNETRKELEDLGKSSDKRAQKSEDELKDKIRNTASQLDDLSLSLEEVKARVERASPGFWQRFISPGKETDDKQAKKELKNLRDGLDYVKANIASQSDIDRAVSSVHGELKELRAKLERLESRSEESKLPEYRESEYREPEKAGLTNYITALVVIIALVAAGYYAYTQFRPFAEPANITTAPSVITSAMPIIGENAALQNETVVAEEAVVEEPVEENVTAAENVTGKNVTENITAEVAAENISVVAANASENIAQPAQEQPNVTKTPQLSDKQMNALIDDCIVRFECTTDAEGNYNFDCYYNFNESGCRCFKGEADVCDQERLAMIASLKESKKPAASRLWERYRLHMIAVAAIIIFAALLIYLFRKGEEEAEREEAGERGKKEETKKPEKKAARKARKRRK